MVQPSLTRRDDQPRCYRALKRTAKLRPSLRDEECAHFPQKLLATFRAEIVGNDKDGILSYEFTSFQGEFRELVNNPLAESENIFRPFN